MRKLHVLAVISVLLVSTINSPIILSSIALSQETTTTTPTPTPSPSPAPTPAPTTTTTPSPAPAPTTAPATTTAPTTTEQKTVSPPPTTETKPVEPTATQTQPAPVKIEPARTESTITEQKPAPVLACAAPPQPPACGGNQGLITNFDSKGCVTGYVCKEIPRTEVGQVTSCPDVPPARITCQTSQKLNTITDAKGCVIGYNCISELSATGPKPVESQTSCPQTVNEKPSCNGNVVPVFDKGCLVSYTCVPQGCRQETDPSGFVRVVCAQERTCPNDDQAKLKEQCMSKGGNPIASNDQSGCQIFDCRFDTREINPNPIGGYQSCPSGDEERKQIDQCKNSGLMPNIAFNGGCRVVKCSQESKPVCSYIPDSEKSRIENECSSRGLSLVKEVDKNGCSFVRCGGGTEVGAQSSCQKNIPPEAYKNCNNNGGEMVVKTDAQGCVAFSQCVTQGDENQVTVSPVKEVPDTAELLSLALKLEHLKIELQKLATDSKEIAKYYSSTGSLDEERYNRVSTMFDSAADKIDEIKVKIKDNAENISPEDMEEIRHDIKYIKEVTLKDILYIMLSNSDDVKETLESSQKVSNKKLSLEEIEQNVKGCGTDGSCFDRAIRSCKPVSFQPEGSNGPSLTIKGLDNGKCVLHVIMQSDNMVPPGYTRENFFMDCSIKDYALGVRGPEDIIPNCEGPMAKFAKQFGGAAQISGGVDEFQQILEKEGGPGGCKSEKECATFCLNNYDECKSWVSEHPAVGPVPTKEELRKYASGDIQKIESGRGGNVQFAGPGGCKGPQECDKFCRSNPDECLKWCDANPDKCPKQTGEVPKSAQGGGGVSSREAASQTQPPLKQQPITQSTKQACAGCLNNGICDIGECSECSDCLRGGPSTTSQIVRAG